MTEQNLFSQLVLTDFHFSVLKARKEEARKAKTSFYLTLLMQIPGPKPQSLGKRAILAGDGGDFWRYCIV